MRVQSTSLRNFCINAMLKAGMSKANAATTADVLVTTDLMGTFTHGSKQLYLLLKNMKEGGLKAKATPEIASEGPAWAIIDGHFAMPMVTSTEAMKLAISKAKIAGIAYVGVKGSSHFGAAGFYANIAAKEGMIGIAMSNVDPCMTVPGGKAPMLGTNPLAYAIPTGTDKTVFLDIATSVAAVSKVYAAKSSGKPIPPGWLVDKDGLPTTDSAKYPEEGAILPMAGHKGYGIAVLVEVLSAVLTGALFTLDVLCWLRDFAKPVNEGHAFIVIDISKMMPIETFKARMDKMNRQLHDAPKAKGAERIYLPGEIEWNNYEKASKEGIDLPDYVEKSLRDLANDWQLNIDELLK